MERKKKTIFIGESLGNRSREDSELGICTRQQDEFGKIAAHFWREWQAFVVPSHGISNNGSLPCAGRCLWSQERVSPNSATEILGY